VNNSPSNSKVKNCEAIISLSYTSSWHRSIEKSNDLIGNELHNLYSSPSIIRIINSRKMRWAGHVARMGKKIAYRILVGKPEGKRPLGRPRRMWVDNTKMDLREIGWDGVDWMGMAHDRDQWRALVNTVLNLRVP
jgi:hypothetical protein